MTFEKQGRQNTEAALKLAIEAAREEGIHKIVVASTTGATAKKLAEMELRIIGRGVKVCV